MATEEKRYVLNFEGKADGVIKAVNEIQLLLGKIDSPRLFGDDIKNIARLREEVEKFQKASLGKTDFTPSEAKELLKSGDKIVEIYNSIGQSIKAASKADLSKFIPDKIASKLNDAKAAIASFRNEYKKLETAKASEIEINAAKQKSDTAKANFDAVAGKKVVNEATYDSYAAEVRTANKKLADARVKAADAESQLSISEENLTKANEGVAHAQEFLAGAYKESDVSRAEGIHKAIQSKEKTVLGDSEYDKLSRKEKDSYVRNSEAAWAEALFEETHGKKGSRKTSVSFLSDEDYDALAEQLKDAQKIQTKAKTEVTKAQTEKRLADSTLANREQVSSEAQKQLDASVKQSDYDKLKKAYEVADEAAKSLVQTNEKLIEQQKQLFGELQKKVDIPDSTPLDSAADAADQKVAEDTNQAVRDLGESIQQLGEQYQEKTQVVEDFNDSQSDQKTQIQKTDEALKDTEGITRRIKAYVSLDAAIRLASRALHSAFQTVKELDAVMTKTAVVTDYSVGDMWAQLPEYTKRANELGVSIKSAYESSTLFYQQGLKTNEVVDVSNATLKMARIAGLGAEDATNKMTAALRGFNMEINKTNATNIADVYSKLASITASNVKEISTAMTNTASIANSAGMSFETTAAFLSQVINFSDQ